MPEGDWDCDDVCDTLAVDCWDGVCVWEAVADPLGVDKTDAVWL